MDRRQKIAKIIADNVHHSAQLNATVIHGAIDEIEKLIGDENSRLREERKELVEALREFCQAVRKSDEKYPDWVGTSEVYDALFKSEALLSKFEATEPKQ